MNGNSILFRLLLIIRLLFFRSDRAFKGFAVLRFSSKNRNELDLRFISTSGAGGIYRSGEGDR